MPEFRGRPSPDGWTAPSGVKPAWNWIPDGHGLHPRWEAVPVWVRLWYRLPFVDRYAHVWMWHRGGWWMRPFEPETTIEPGDRVR